MRPVKIRLWNEGSHWSATLEGTASPILRPVPGNTHPAQRATWPTEESARIGVAELIGFPVEVVAVYP